MQLCPIYLKICRNKDIETDIRSRTTKTVWSMDSIVWRNSHIGIAAKLEIYYDRQPKQGMIEIAALKILSRIRIEVEILGKFAIQKS